MQRRRLIGRFAHEGSEYLALVLRRARLSCCQRTFAATASACRADDLTFTGVNSGAVQQCQGGSGSNSWYGNGQVDALNAIGG